VETGLRAGELASLTRASFALDGEHPTVSLAAAYSKRRRLDVLPLRPDTAAELRGFLASKLPDAAAFNTPKHRPLSEVLRDDLADARKAWLENATSPQERQKRETAAGVHPKVAQAVMRHSSIDLTMSRYTHVFRGQETDAVAALPDLDVAPVKQLAKATGTDHATAQAAQDATGRPRTGDRAQARPMDRPRPDDDGRKAGEKNSASCLAREGSLSRASSRDDAREVQDGDNEKTPVNTDESQHSQGHSPSRPPGLEPGTCGLEDRCSVRVELRASAGIPKYENTAWVCCIQRAFCPAAPGCSAALAWCRGVRARRGGVTRGARGVECPRRPCGPLPSGARARAAGRFAGRPDGREPHGPAAVFLGNGLTYARIVVNCVGVQFRVSRVFLFPWRHRFAQRSSARPRWCCAGRADLAGKRGGHP